MIHKLLSLPVCLVPKDQRQPFVQIGFGFQSFGNTLRGEANGRKNIGVGVKGQGGAVAAHLPPVFEWRGGLAAAKALLPFHPIPADTGHHPVGQGVDHGSAHAVQPPGMGVVLIAEFPAGVQGGQNQFQGRLLELRMQVYRNPPPVVGHGDG